MPHEKVNGQAQGGMCALPLPPFPTGIMRGRVPPDRRATLRAAACSPGPATRPQPGGFYRVRYTGKPADLPVGLKAKAGGVEVTFTDALDPKTRRTRRTTR